MLCCCKGSALSDTAAKCVEQHNGRRRRLCSKCSNSVTDSNPSCFRPPTSVPCDCRGDFSFRKQLDGNKRDGTCCAHDGDDGWKSQASECRKHNTDSLFSDAGDSGATGSLHTTTAEPQLINNALLQVANTNFTTVLVPVGQLTHVLGELAPVLKAANFTVWAKELNSLVNVASKVPLSQLSASLGAVLGSHTLKQVFSWFESNVLSAASTVTLVETTAASWNAKLGLTRRVTSIIEIASVVEGGASRHHRLITHRPKRPHNRLALATQQAAPPPAAARAAACSRTRLSYAARFALKRANASPCAGDSAFGVCTRVCHSAAKAVHSKHKRARTSNHSWMPTRIWRTVVPALQPSSSRMERHTTPDG